MAHGFSSARRRLTALRLTALGIDSPGAATPGDVVRNAFASQAQDFPGVLWSVGLRTSGATASEVESAHAAGDFVRSWPMRGTLHLVASEDLGWMLQLTGPRMVRSSAGRHRQLELTDGDFSRAESVARGRLGGGEHLARAALLSAFDAAGVSTTGQRGAHLLGTLAQLGVVVLSARDSWTLLDDWVPAPRVLDRDAALREFALRYFTSHGPATVRDFSWWSSLTLTDARAGLATAREHLVELELDGQSYFMRPGLEPAQPAVHLLPGFDEYVLGYTDRSAQLSGEHANSIVPGGNGMFLSTIVVDGEIVGTWKRDRRSNRVIVTPVPFRPMSSVAQRRMLKRLARYGEFLGTDVELSAQAGDRATSGSRTLRG